jgi:hypothetical protein
VDFRRKATHYQAGPPRQLVNDGLPIRPHNTLAFNNIFAEIVDILAFGKLYNQINIFPPNSEIGYEVRKIWQKINLLWAHHHSCP